MIYYWNFIMVHDGILTTRIRYNLLDILGDVGGFRGAIESILMIIFGIYNYKYHEAVVY
jgi:hypothetical protein